MDKFIHSIIRTLILYQSFIVFTAIILGLPILLRDIPYINLIVTFERTIFAYLVLMLILIRPKVKTLFLLAIFLLLIASFLLLLGFGDVPEQVGTIIFFLFFIGTIRIIVLSYKAKND